MIIATCGQKGGAGKSITAIAIAGELEQRGRRVLLVDADTLGTARSWGARASTRAGAPVVVQMGETMHQPGQLPRLVPNFDDVVIDCPGRNGAVQRSALAVADLALLPCNGEPPEVESLAESIEVVVAARRRFPRLRGAILLTRIDARTAMGRQARDTIQAGQRQFFVDTGMPIEDMLPVLRTVLHRRTVYPELQASGLTIARYAAPNHPAIDEVRALVDEITSVKETTIDGQEADVFDQEAAAGGIRG